MRTETVHCDKCGSEIPKTREAKGAVARQKAKPLTIVFCEGGVSKLEIDVCGPCYKQLSSLAGRTLAQESGIRRRHHGRQKSAE
jgi:hypothetical protein